MNAELPASGVKEKFLLFVGRRKGVKVAGDSMQPILKDGDLVLFDAGRPAAVGDIVLAIHPYKHTNIIKRLVSIDAEGRAQLLGDNAAASTDSRTFGSVSLEYILGRATSSLKK